MNYMPKIPTDKTISFLHYSLYLFLFIFLTPLVVSISSLLLFILLSSSPQFSPTHPPFYSILFLLLSSYSLCICLYSSSLYSIFSFFLIFFNFSIYSFIFCMTFLFFITCCISSITFLFLLTFSNRINW